MIPAHLIQRFWSDFDRRDYVRAEDLARELAQNSPQEAEPWYLLGVLGQVAQKPEPACRFYAQALACNPDHGSTLNNLGVLLTALGHHSQAVQLLERKVRLQPEHADGHFNLANALAAQGRRPEAFPIYERALALQPEFAEALVNLGAYLYQEGRSADALAPLERALRLQPDNLSARLNYAYSLLGLRRFADALPHLLQARTLASASAELLTNIGYAQIETGDYAAAGKILKECAEAFPNYPLVYKQLGILCFRVNRLEDGVVFLKQFLAHLPRHGEGHQNLGFLLTNLGRYDEAMGHLNEARKYDPNLVETYNSIGITLGRQGRDDESLAAFDEALVRSPQFWEVHSNRAMILLRNQRFAEGWPEYECRLMNLPASESSAPQWQGESLAGKTILLTWEQGLGDTIMFVRYVPTLKARGARVLCQVQKPLHPLLRSLSVELLERGQELPSHDVQSPLPSLPYRLGDLEAPVPYLSADADLIEKWRPRIAELSGLRVGIAWQGDVGFQGDRHRSVPLRHYAKLSALPDVTLIGLQKTHGLEQIEPNRATVQMLNWGPDLDNDVGAFMDTAAIMTLLDLVVTSDTAIVHLAGALGVPVWLATSYAPDWRWFREGAESRWYPSLRMFRQPRLDDWESVFDEIARALKGTKPRG